MNSRRKSWSMLLLALVILVPSCLGFANKFFEFIMLYRGEADGIFAITPILNYLLAGAGFMLLFFWAALNGMFHDIEGPKYSHLQRERMLDQQLPAPVPTVGDHSQRNRVEIH